MERIKAVVSKIYQSSNQLQLAYDNVHMQRFYNQLPLVSSVINEHT